MSIELLRPLGIDASGPGGRDLRVGGSTLIISIYHIRSIIRRIGNERRLDARAFHDAMEMGLLAAGFSVHREYQVPDRGDGKMKGFIDLVITSPERVAIELDRKKPRKKSILKLKQFDGLKIIVLRESGRDKTREIKGIHTFIAL